MQGLSLVAASGGHSSSQCVGLSLLRPLLLWSTSSRRAGSVVVAHGLSCSVACGIFPDQGSNPCPLHRQADSQPLCHQGSPQVDFFYSFLSCNKYSAGLRLCSVITKQGGHCFTAIKYKSNLHLLHINDPRYTVIKWGEKDLTPKFKKFQNSHVEIDPGTNKQVNCKYIQIHLY